MTPSGWDIAVGVVTNSDGHKGRPGASYPGAGKFGAIGGLSCFLMDKLDRENFVGLPAQASSLRNYRWRKRANDCGS